MHSTALRGMGSDGRKARCLPEVTLHAERPVVEKEAVPVERVRLAKEQVADEETVSGDIRKEQIETEGDTDISQ